MASPGSQVNLTEQRSIYAGGNELQLDGETDSPEPVPGGGAGSLAPAMGSRPMCRWSRRKPARRRAKGAQLLQGETWEQNGCCLCVTLPRGAWSRGRRRRGVGRCYTCSGVAKRWVCWGRRLSGGWDPRNDQNSLKHGLARV